MKTVYVNSQGQEHQIAEMNYWHLKAATMKAEQNLPGGEQTLALRAELDRRDEAFRASQQQTA